MKIKSIFLGLLASVLFITSAIANPLIVPMAIGLQLITLMGVGAAIEMSNGLPEPSKAVGQKALSVTLDDSSGNSARIPTTTSADSAASIPAPAAPATASQYYYYGTAAGGAGGDSPTAACQAYISAAYPAGNATMTGSPAYPGSCSWLYLNAYPGSTAITRTSVCPAGYSVSGSSCVLSNARATDKAKDYTRSGQSFAPQSGEPASPMDNYLNASTVAVSNDTLTINGQSPAGEPRQIQIQNSSTGGSTIKASTQKTDGAGNTYVQNNSYTIDSSGTITGATGASVNGQLTNTGTGAYSYTGNGSSYTPAPEQGGGAGCGGAGQPKCAIDDSGFSGQNAGNAQALTDLNTQAGLRDQALQDAKNNAPGFGTSWIPSLMPGGATACSAFQWHFALAHGPMTGFSSDHQFDICNVLSLVQQILSWFFFVVTVVYVSRKFFNSNAGQA